MHITACQVLDATVIYMLNRQCPSWVLYSPDNQLPTEPCLLVLRSRCHCRQAEIDEHQSADTENAVKDPKIMGELYAPFPEHSSMSFYFVLASSLLLWPGYCLEPFDWGKNDSVHFIKFLKLDRRRWVERYEADDGWLNLRWGTEVVPRDVDDIVRFFIELTFKDDEFLW